MRALWSLAVVGLVAASGAGRVDARTEPRAAALARCAPPSAQVVVARPALHAVSGRARALDRQLPPVALAPAFSFRAPAGYPIAQPSFACDRPVVSLIRTCSARGPPIA